MWRNNEVSCGLKVEGGKNTAGEQTSTNHNEVAAYNALCCAAEANDVLFCLDRKKYATPYSRSR